VTGRSRISTVSALADAVVADLDGGRGDVLDGLDPLEQPPQTPLLNGAGHGISFPYTALPSMTQCSQNLPAVIHGEGTYRSQNTPSAPTLPRDRTFSFACTDSAPPANEGLPTVSAMRSTYFMRP